MPTNKLVAKTTEEILLGPTPVLYNPLYAIFAEKNPRQYEAEVGQMVFRAVTTIGDIRAKDYTPKDTEVKEIAVGEGSKIYKRYFKAIRYKVSQFQDNQDSDQIIREVLDENMLLADEMFLYGEGNSPSTVKNNGLYFSQDPNFILSSSETIVAGDGALADMYAKVLVSAEKAKDIAGQKFIIFYGEAAKRLSGMFAVSGRTLRSVLTEALGTEFALITMPTKVQPTGEHGWIIVNEDQVALHYTLFPQVLDSGENREEMYNWYNVGLGSMMLDVRAKGAVDRQPVTFAT